MADKRSLVRHFAISRKYRIDQLSKSGAEDKSILERKGSLPRFYCGIVNKGLDPVLFMCLAMCLNFTSF